MKKQALFFILKIWGTAMLAAPLLFVVLMGRTLAAMPHARAEILLVIFITMILAILYYSLSLGAALIISNFFIKTDNSSSIKLITTLCLLIPIAIESIFLYRNNLSMVYKGTGVMILCYLSSIILAASVYKINKKNDQLIHQDFESY